MPGRIVIEVRNHCQGRMARIDTADFPGCVGLYIEIVPDEIRDETAAARAQRLLRDHLPSCLPAALAR